MGGVPPDQAELELLIELASGAKTFVQVERDAARFGLASLIHANPSRGITERLKELTSISKETLDFFPIRCKPETATIGNKGVLLSVAHCGRSNLSAQPLECFCQCESRRIPFYWYKSFSSSSSPLVRGYSTHLEGKSRLQCQTILRLARTTYDDHAYTREVCLQQHL